MSKELKTGAIALVIIVLFIWGYNFLKREDIFSPNTRHFFVEYNSIQGLNEASLVTINGLQAGKIVNIVFNENPEKRGKLVVELALTTNLEFSKKSIAKIYSAGLIGGQNLAIVPSYKGKIAVSGDYLKGEVESDILSAVSEKLNPLQAKLGKVIVHADSLLIGLNQVINKPVRQSLNRSILNLEQTVSGFQKTAKKVNLLLDANRESLTSTLNNTKKITEDFSKISHNLAGADLSGTVKKMKLTLTNINDLIDGMKAGKGTLGKLIVDDAMYKNLTNASKELAELLRELKLNPKRFVHFSLFGKKAKPYNPEKNPENKSN